MSFCAEATAISAKISNTLANALCSFEIVLPNGIGNRFI